MLNYAITNRQKWYHKNARRRHCQCREFFPARRRWSGWLHSPCSRAKAFSGMSHFGRLSYRRCKDYKRLWSALQLCHSRSRSYMERRTVSWAGAAYFLLWKFLSTCKRKTLWNHSISTDFFRNLRLSESSGAEGCNRRDQRISYGKWYDSIQVLSLLFPHSFIPSLLRSPSSFHPPGTVS